MKTTKTLRLIGWHVDENGVKSILDVRELEFHGELTERTFNGQIGRNIRDLLSVLAINWVEVNRIEST